MSVQQVLVLVAAVLAVYAQFEARGRSVVAWAILLLCTALLWGRLG